MRPTQVEFWHEKSTWSWVNYLYEMVKCLEICQLHVKFPVEFWADNHGWKCTCVIPFAMCPIRAYKPNIKTKTNEQASTHPPFRVWGSHMIWCTMWYSRNNIIIAATNHLTTFFSLQTLFYGSWKKTFVNKHATAMPISFIYFGLNGPSSSHPSYGNHLGTYRTPNNKLRREIGNVLCLKCKNAVKYTKSNSRCRSGNMTVYGLGITGV